MILARIVLAYQTESVTYAAGRFTHRSTAIYGRGMDFVQGRFDQGADLTGLKAAEVGGIKFGAKIKAQQSIESLVVRSDDRDVTLSEDRAVTQELQQTFGADAGEKWVGFSLPPVRYDEKLLRGGILATPYTVTLTGVTSLPQPVVVAYAFGNDTFRQHGILGVVVLSTDMGKLETFLQSSR